MKNIKDLLEFEDADFFRGNTRGYLNYISESQKQNLKSFILSDRQEVLKMVLESLPKEEHPKEQDKTWNDCLSEIKQRINNLTIK